MAIVNLDSKKVAANFNTISVGELTASNTDGLEYTVNAGDEKTVLVAYNSSADTAYDLTIKSPTNKCVGGSNVDKVVEIAAGKIALVAVETAKYMDSVSKKVTLDSENAAIKAIVFEIDK